MPARRVLSNERELIGALEGEDIEDIEISHKSGWLEIISNSTVAIAMDRDKRYFRVLKHRGLPVTNEIYHKSLLTNIIL